MRLFSVGHLLPNDARVALCAYLHGVRGLYDARVPQKEIRRTEDQGGEKKDIRRFNYPINIFRFSSCNVLVFTNYLPITI
jgi:hypothetical protein